MAKMKMALASDGKMYPVEEVVRNKGTVGQARVVFVGTSYKFVHKVVRDMLLVGGFDECEVVLLDLADQPLRIVGDLLEKMIAQSGAHMRVIRTKDRKTALKGADVVLLSITVGGLEADERAAEVCAKHGYYVTVGDTMGPAALARNLRTLPVVLDIARDMEKYCPKATLLNFTNPMSCISGTINRFSGIRTMGLCHSAEDLLTFFARVYKTTPDAIEMTVGGVNHMSFVTSLVVKGKERIHTIVQDAEKSGEKLEDTLLGKTEKMNIQQDLYDMLGAFPSTGDEHAAEFYKYFLTKKYVKEMGLHVKKIQKKRGALPSVSRKPPEILLKWAYGDGPVEDMDFMTTEHAHELMWAVMKGTPTTRVVNILNDGYIAGLPKTACVEVMVTVTKTGYKGEELVLPTACTALLSQWTAIHELTIKASLEGDREAARQALFLDPFVRDMYEIDPMLDDFISALGKWLPKWKKRKK